MRRRDTFSQSTTQFGVNPTFKTSWRGQFSFWGGLTRRFGHDVSNTSFRTRRARRCVLRRFEDDPLQFRSPGNRLENAVKKATWLLTKAEVGFIYDLNDSFLGGRRRTELLPAGETRKGRPASSESFFDASTKCGKSYFAGASSQL